jgi:hypothetical protein
MEIPKALHFITFDVCVTTPSVLIRSFSKKSLPRATIPQMPTDHILSLLISERDKLNRAIEVLQGTPRGSTRRKPALPAIDAPAPTDQTRERPRWTAAKRRAAAERAKAVWVRRRKGATKRG